MSTLYSKSLWWGYLHINGNYQAKRYFEALDIIEAKQSPFVVEVAGPFQAKDREDALKIVELNLRRKK